MLAQNFMENLRRMRLKRGLTQQDLAAKADRSLSFVSEVERGNREPSFESIEAFAAALGVSPIRMLSEPR
jgi:transcriptional regulator with XRE-family HTH domain